MNINSSRSSRKQRKQQRNMKNPTKERLYAHMAQHLQVLQANLVETSRQLELMSEQCNKNIVGQLGRVHASWFMASNRHFEEEMLGKTK